MRINEIDYDDCLRQFDLYLILVMHHKDVFYEMIVHFSLITHLNCLFKH